MRRLLVVIPATLALAACGGGSGSSEGPVNANGDVLQTVSISTTEFALSPATVMLPQAGTYELSITNKGRITHALEIEAEGGGAEAETDEIGPGETKTLRFTFSGGGSYEMYCPIGKHRDEGMKGTIMVGNVAGGTTTGEDERETTTDSDPGY
jgi:plastocyanin